MDAESALCALDGVQHEALGAHVESGPIIASDRPHTCGPGSERMGAWCAVGRVQETDFVIFQSATRGSIA